MQKKIRVLHILATNKFSGAENVACQIINLCKDDGIESVYCSPIGEIKEALQLRKIDYYPIELLTVKNLKKVVSDVRPNIIHAHDRYATVIACSCFSNIPIISQLHGNFDDMKKITLNNMIYTLIGIKLKKIICVSNSIKEDWIFSHLYKNKVLTQRNVVDIDIKKYKNTENIYDICFVGRLVHEKNIPRLMNILNLLKKEIPNYKAVICGHGVEKNYLINFIQINNLENNISYLGFVNNPLEYIYQSKIMLITSRNEGTPMAALECLALGKPIISTPVDGLLEVIKNGVNGYLANSDDEIVQHIFDILNDNSKYDNLCQGVKEMNLEINNVNKYRKSFISIYNELINIE